MSAAATSLKLAISHPPRLRGMPPSHLTEREEQIVSLVAQGLQSKEISQALQIAPDTVDAHRHNIYVKLGISGVVGMVHYALARGLVRNKFQSDNFYGS